MENEVKRKVCVITGGGSGMGLATAHRMAKKGYYTILCGRTVSKLENAVNELREAGGEAEAFPCDVSDRESCFALARHAAECGEVKVMLHIAGLSPHMGDSEKIMAGNALGTVNINDAFYEVMAPGGCLIDTSSMSAYLTPAFIMPTGAYPLSRTDREKFMKKMMGRVNMMPKKTRTGVAYSVSKHFVIWFAKTDAARFGAKGVRVLSVTPGNFETPMGALEKDEAGTYLKFNAIKRNGKPEEIAALYEMLTDEQLGYLTRFQGKISQMGTVLRREGRFFADGDGSPLRRTVPIRGEPSLSAIYTSPISGMMKETYRFWVFLYFRGDMFM